MKRLFFGWLLMLLFVVPTQAQQVDNRVKAKFNYYDSMRKIGLWEYDKAAEVSPYSNNKMQLLKRMVAVKSYDALSIDVIVSKYGAVKACRCRPSVSQEDQSMINACVKKLEFAPAKMESTPVESIYTIIL
ncbi:hypothetical protein K5X82_03055 [Halosquirtibacter xylanolyticus]|uniref:hypothetical protein n=1 Tax=Halosquirtibacter xylanolyticus TaxID=3374599 RepID=UPI003747E8A2|nr:hypothetical protein K5X82_03055 [Prolixibacteraceae bacterium]